MKGPVLVFTLFLLFTHFSFASENLTPSAIVPFEHYGELPQISMVRISPDGKLLAYRTTENKQNRIIIFDLEKGTLLDSINVEKIRPNHIYFINDQKIILVGTKNKKINLVGNRDFSAAFVYDIASQKIKQLLVQGKGISRWQNNLSSIVGLSKDQEHVFMPARRGEKNGLKSRYNLMKVSLNTDVQKPALFKRSEMDTIDFFLDGQDKVVARERYNQSTNEHRVEVLRDDQWVEIFKEVVEIRQKVFVALTSDSDALITWIYNDEGRLAYYSMSLQDGSLSDAIFERQNADVEQVYTDINRKLVGVRFSGYSPSYEFVNPKIDKLIASIVKGLPDNTVRISDFTPDWSKIIFYLEGKGKSGEYILYNNGQFQQIALARPNITADKVNDVFEFSYKARDGLTIPTLLTFPNTAMTSKVKLPAIMMPHGGPASYDKKGFDWLAQYFASRGFLVIQPQFRGSRGFGIEHTNKGRREWGQKMQDDLTDGVRELVKMGEIDPDRVCIVGASYGGYAALMGAAKTPELYKCVVSINGVSDIEDIIREGKKRYGEKHWVLSYWKDIIADDDLSDNFLAKISPINHVEKVNSPVLLIHGEIDQVVPVEQSKNMYRELKSENKNVTFIQLPGEGHSLSKQQPRMQALKAIDNFIKDI